MTASPPFVQAAHFTVTTGRTVDLAVVHDMEYPEKPTTAEWCADFFHGPGAPEASAHYCVDNNSVVQCVLEKDVAWHAPGANHNGIGIEHAGYARQTRSDWLDPYGREMLAVSVELVAGIVERYAIPVEHRTAADLLKGLRGLTGHADVTNAFHRSDHQDPGSGFPWDYYLNAIREAVRPDHKPEPHVQFVALLPGDTGWRVTRLQRLLDALPYVKVTPDGAFGPLTERAVKQLQRKAGIRPTGRVGEPTWKALLAAQA
jgi:N-acetyl-anhydromuramyl-L-alanine amidase AmpD